MNLLGVIDVTLESAAPGAKARGRVVNVSSILGRVSIHGGGYCISKKGVESLLQTPSGNGLWWMPSSLLLLCSEPEAGDVGWREWDKVSARLLHIHQT